MIDATVAPSDDRRHRRLLGLWGGAVDAIHGRSHLQSAGHCRHLSRPESWCLRSLAIPLGHLRDLIVYLWAIISCGILVVFCGTLVDFRTCLVVPLDVLDC